VQSDDDDSDERTGELRDLIDDLDGSDSDSTPPVSETVGIAASAAAGINSVWEPYITLLLRIDFEAVRKDIRLLLTDSQEFWPADYGTYGPFFIHWAWHCSATYRVTDGRGGCEGGRVRFEPERSFGENANKDRAIYLLQPIKDKYGICSRSLHPISTICRGLSLVRCACVLCSGPKRSAFKRRPPPSLPPRSYCLPSTCLCSPDTSTSRRQGFICRYVCMRVS
jgi:hypothetical protein